MKSIVFVVLLAFCPLSQAAGLEQIRLLNASFVLAVYLVFVALIVWRYRARQKRLEKLGVPDTDDASILVAYASQTGQALQIAQKTVDSLAQSGIKAKLLVLNDVTADLLDRTKHALFVVSTTGEGDAPDNASNFASNYLGKKLDISQLEYGVLALGDSGYAYFCGFGHTLDAWLQRSHALPMFDLIEVDRADDGALRHWQYQLGVLTNNTELTDWEPPAYEKWRLAFRQCLNPHGIGAPTYHLRLAKGSFAIWSPGDIAEIGPRNNEETIREFCEALQISPETMLANGIVLSDGLRDRLFPHDSAILSKLKGLSADMLISKLPLMPHREYSIASTTQDGGIELLVRQTQHPDGRLGLGSGWLTKHAELDGEIALRIRSNPGFHAPSPGVPMILIGNGTGLAGLLAHLRARIRNKQYENWLIFGERNAEHDFYFQWELEGWLNKGHLTKLDTAFSRDQEAPVYVQHKLEDLGDELVDWVDRGAVIYVCGSATGMAPTVHGVLQKLLGDERLAELATQGRYRRDVY